MDHDRDPRLWVPNSLLLLRYIALEDLLLYHAISQYGMARVEIKCNENGPELVLVDGKVFAAMCRCGASSSKPYCDGSHARIGFKAEAKDIVVVEQ